MQFAKAKCLPLFMNVISYSEIVYFCFLCTKRTFEFGFWCTTYIVCTTVQIDEVEKDIIDLIKVWLNGRHCYLILLCLSGFNMMEGVLTKNNICNITLSFSYNLTSNKASYLEALYYFITICTEVILIILFLLLFYPLINALFQSL